MPGIEWPEEGPQVDVWNHLQTGLDLADEELDFLPKALRKLTEKVAEALLDNRRNVILALKEKGWVELDETLLAHPWVRYAADLEIASEGVARATKGLDRYAEITPAVATDAIPEKARVYIREVIHTYIFGFDPACLALCRATLEQLLKERLVAAGIFTGPQIKRERLTAGGLLEKAKQNGLVVREYDAAKKVVERGDQLMHSHMFDEKILKQMAADSIRDLTAVAVELMGSPPSFE
jgi:hypothetical protein